MVDDLIRVIRSVLGKGLTFDEASTLAGAGKPLQPVAGTVVFREGDPAQGLFVFLRGTVDIIKRGGNGAEHTIATIEAPTVVGEMSLVTERAHSATMRTRTDCEFLLLDKPSFLRLLGEERLAAYKVLGTIAEVLAHRLQRMDEKVMDLSAQQDCPAPVEELAAFKHKLFSEWSF
jgi:CRP-like cAMP-binding protein